MKFLDPTRKEFYRTARHNLRYNVLEFMAMLPFAVLIYAAVTHHLNDTPFVGGLFGGSFCVAISMISMVLNQKIVVTRYGIEYHVGWSRIETKWKDIERIVFRWDLFPKTEGLLIPRTESLSSSLSELFIPLSLFAENWRESELGEEIKKNAPHLFEISQE